LRFVAAVLLATLTPGAAQTAPPSNPASAASGIPRQVAPGPLSSNPPQNELLWGKMEAQVQKVSHDLDGTIGVAVLDLTDGRSMLINGDAVFPTASSIKLAVLAELYRQEQQGQSGATGKARLSDAYVFDKKDLVADSAILSGLTPGVTRLTNRDLATFMVVVSDNSAANILIDRVGMQNVNALLTSVGLQHTRLQRKMMDVKAAQEGRENLATAKDMTNLLAALYRGQVLNQQLTADFFQVLGNHKESNMPRYLPDDVVVANKPGELAGIRNDVGVVFAPNRPFVLCVMTAYLKHERDGDDAIAKIADIAYGYFSRLGASSEYGRVVSERNSH
jgi:beta-lactamase class A